MKMNKKDLIAVMSEKMGLPKTKIKNEVLPQLKEVLAVIKNEGGLTASGVGKVAVTEKTGKAGTMNGVAYDHTGEKKTVIKVTFNDEFIESL